MPHGIPHAIRVGHPKPRLWRVVWGLPKRSRLRNPKHCIGHWTPGGTDASTIHGIRLIVLNPKLLSDPVESWISFLHELDHAADSQALAENPRTAHRHTKAIERVATALAHGSVRMACACKACNR